MAYKRQTVSLPHGLTAHYTLRTRKKRPAVSKADLALAHWRKQQWIHGSPQIQTPFY
ncbi:hypothetical protein SEA_FORZA_188 [Gordonia phage Forza]|uniref:Uncharacterized protein n=1 Tax=Gordonia phage Forza TaxID=2571247 RepID=A0A650EZ79_9CAUD|nr:hypothetical protein PP303_gp140 [Gordonia phage Forza]QEM41624.1 hypothetical protein SEA_BOOPY_188 [Gordonia phage Boopy]QGT55149.1 hypothetical protein SEA_FORZA_188 [Gordonia phage Forza]UXE04297.1 hypothetical protein SEA_BLUENGOLD_184 [Gordonia phage BlueNGold]WBF03938.1 hypothetical protein SEA_MAREELIH_185 [Gordonia phage Mareelih]